jgi:hypothetical protein
VKPYTKQEWKLRELGSQAEMMVVGVKEAILLLSTTAAYLYCFESRSHQESLYKRMFYTIP